jgi:hypothetical protein
MAGPSTRSSGRPWRGFACRASACGAAQEGPHDVALMGRGAGAGGGVEREPHALFWDGVTLDQLKSALAELTARGWKPPEALPAA